MLFAPIDLVTFCDVEGIAEHRRHPLRPQTVPSDRGDQDADQQIDREKLFDPVG